MKLIRRYAYHITGILLIGTCLNCLVGILGWIRLDFPSAVFVSFCLLAGIGYTGFHIIIRNTFDIQRQIAKLTRKEN